MAQRLANTIRSLGCATCLLATPPGAASAQSEWLDARRTGAALEFRHPVLQEASPDDDPSPLGGAWFLSGRVDLARRGIALVGEVPFGYASFRGESAAMLGNIRLGVEKKLGRSLVAEAGVRLPTGSGLGEVLSITRIVASSSEADRPDAFSDHTFGPRVGLRGRASLAPSVHLAAHGGLAWMLGDDADDLVFDYGARAFATPGAARVGLGVDGVVAVTGDPGETVLDRTWNHVVVWLDHGFGALRPGVSISVPVQVPEALDRIEYVVGLSVEATVGRGTDHR